MKTDVRDAFSKLPNARVIWLIMGFPLVERTLKILKSLLLVAFFEGDLRLLIDKLFKFAIDFKMFG